MGEGPAGISRIEQGFGQLLATENVGGVRSNKTFEVDHIRIVEHSLTLLATLRD